jgi:hypothetical protein
VGGQGPPFHYACGKSTAEWRNGPFEYTFASSAQRMGWETYKRNHAGDELSDAAQAAWSDNVMIRQLLAKREVAKSEQFNVFMVLSITLCQIVSNVRMSDTDRARVQAPGSDSSAKGMFVYRQTLTQLSSYTTSPNTGSWLLIFSVPCSSKPEGANEFEV